MTVMTSPLDKLTWPRHTARLALRPATPAVRESLHRSGQWLDTFAYALLADEHRGTQAA